MPISAHPVTHWLMNEVAELGFLPGRLHVANSSSRIQAFLDGFESYNTNDTSQKIFKVLEDR